MLSSRSEPIVRIFIGSGDASVLERKTLIHSIKVNTSRQLEIWWYNGTTHTLENEAGEKWQCPEVPTLQRHCFATEFSLFRYLIPHLCSFRGKAIYLDSDMVVCDDIGKLFDISLQGFEFAACPDAYPGIAPDRWALSVLLIDCSLCRFDLGMIFFCIEQGRFSYAEFAQMGRRAQAILRYRIKRLPSCWNDFDRINASTKLIHYTDLDRQPWMYPYHDCGETWFENFRHAIRAGSITDQDVRTAIERGFARPDIMKGNYGDDTVKKRILAFLHALRLMLRDLKRQAERMITSANV